MEVAKAANIDALQKEYIRVSGAIRQIESQNDKIVGFGITIIVAGFGYGVTQDVIEILFFVPISMMGVFIYATLQYYNVFWLGGYNRAVEQVLNNFSDVPIAKWEELVNTYKPRYSIYNVSIFVVYFIVMLSITLFCAFRIFVEFGFVFQMVFGLIILCFCATLFLAFSRMTDAYHLSYERACELFGVANTQARSASEHHDEGL